MKTVTYSKFLKILYCLTLRKTLIKFLYLLFIQSVGFLVLVEVPKKSNHQHPLDHQKSKRVPENHLFPLY